MKGNVSMISVIIPTYNAKGNIEPLLSALKVQDLGQNSLEILVVDSSSQDGTAEYCTNIPDVHLIKIKKEEFNHGHTRNVAASHAQGDVFVFMTQDAVPYNSLFLLNLVSPILKGKAVAAFGRQVARPNALPMEVLTRLYNYPEIEALKSRENIKDLGIKTFFFTNVCSAVSRQAFEETRGFPDHVILNEDMMLAYKLIQSGYKIAYAAQAQVIHSHNYTCMQQFRRNFDIAVSLKMNGEILRYAHAETEGKKYIAYVCQSLMQGKKYMEIVRFMIQSAFKLVGYRMGMHYKRIPVFLKKKISMNPDFWKAR